MIYFVRAMPDGPVKIGWSKNVHNRLRELQVSHHAELEEIRRVDGAADIERRLHAYFAEANIRGEWFDFRPEMLTVDVETLPPVKVVIKVRRPRRQLGSYSPNENWYQKLSRTKRKRVILANKRKRQKMTDSERELMRAKWRLAKQRQRQLRTREGQGHMTW